MGLNLSRSWRHARYRKGKSDDGVKFCAKVVVGDLEACGLIKKTKPDLKTKRLNDKQTHPKIPNHYIRNRRWPRQRRFRIADGLKRFAAPECLVNIVRAIEESHLLAEKLAEFYNYLLRHHQHLMKYYYWAIEHFRPNESSLFYRMTSRYVRQLFEKYCPQVVVSVHPMTQHFLGRMLRELGLLDRIPLVTVVTDPCYGFWRGWACEEVSLYLVATEEARQQLIDYCVPVQMLQYIYDL